MEEAGREDAFGGADSTITPHSSTISKELLLDCLKIKEKMAHQHTSQRRLLYSVIV